MRKVKAAFVVGGLMGLAALAGSFQTYRVFINGKETKDLLVRDGKAYVSIAALRDAGAEVTTDGNRIMVRFNPPAGREQIDAVEGRINEWLDNGSWRVRVTEVTKGANPFGVGPGFAVTVEFRNLRKSPVSLNGTGFDNFLLIDTKGNMLSAAASGSYNKRYDTVPPGAGIVMNLRFGDPKNALTEVGEPEKLMILFRNWGGTKLKDFRIFLRDTGDGNQAKDTERQ